MKFLELEVQRKIYNHIGKNPGIGLKQLLKKFQKNSQKLEYHLKQMCRDELIVRIKEDGVEKYYLKNLRIGLRDRRILEIRRKIYDIVLTYPGLHLSKIAKILDIRTSLTEYHLHCMQKDDLITGVKEKGYTRYYIKDSEIGILEKKMISLLRQKLPFQIVLFLLKQSHARHCDISQHLHVSSSKLTYHLDKLVDLDIVVPSQKEGQNGYCLRDKKQMKSIIRRFKLKSIGSSLSDT